MKYVLVPTEIPEKITLYEALLWIAFNMYVTASFFDEHIDMREREEEYFELEKPFEMVSFFNEEVCKKYDLPINPTNQYFQKNIGIPYNHHLTWEKIAKYENDPSFDKENLKQIKKEKKEYAEFMEKQEPFDEALEMYLEIPKSKLFIKLREGEVIAYGRELFKNLKWENEELDKNTCDIEDIFDCWEDGLPDFTEISKEEWIFNCIDWDTSCLKNRDVCYCHVLIDFKSLLSCFPETETETQKVYSVNGTLLIDDALDGKKIIPKKRGRKQEYDEKAFTAEMIRRHDNGELPLLQKTCILDMHDWCQKVWGKTPKETWLKDHIFPFYKAKKSANKK